MSNYGWWDNYSDAEKKAFGDGVAAILRTKMLWLILIALLVIAFKCGQRTQPPQPPHPTVKVSRLTPRQYVERRIARAVQYEAPEWGKAETDAMLRIAFKESSMRPMARHPVSSAHGLFGFLDATWEQCEGFRTDDPFMQTICAVRYAKARYGRPTKALAFHNKRGWW